jgi:TRAP-type mannitol/chloroaromatic compound transport system permease small subunit
MTKTPSPAIGTMHHTGPVAALQRAADAFSIAGALLAAACIVALTFLVLSEIAVVTLSKFIPSVPSSIHVGWEYSAYLMGASFLLGAGMTLRAGLQIRVEMLMRAGHGRYARLLEGCSSALGSAVAVFLAYTLVQLTVRTYHYGEVSQDSFTPLWIPQAVLAFGALILALQMLARTLTCLAGQLVDRPELGASTAIEG